MSDETELLAVRIATLQERIRLMKERGEDTTAAESELAYLQCRIMEDEDHDENDGETPDD